MLGEILATVSTAGTLSVWPIFSTPSSMPLAALSEETLTPVLLAILLSVSPDSTV